MGTPGNANPRIGALEKSSPTDSAATPSEWHSRGYLPHFDCPIAIQHVTFHLADSLPQTVLKRIQSELDLLSPAEQDTAKRKKIATWLDAGHGSCTLRDPAHARLVQNTLLDHDAIRYRLYAWVIMPNHVHVLFEPLNDWPVSKIVATWKRFTATQISRMAGNANPHTAESKPGNANPRIGDRIGAKQSPLWHREYWDRYIRDQAHFQQALDYIHNNPVKAGLVPQATDWPWSSAANPGNANPRIGEKASSTPTPS